MIMGVDRRTRVEELENITEQRTSERTRVKREREREGEGKVEKTLRTKDKHNEGEKESGRRGIERSRRVKWHRWRA